MRLAQQEKIPAPAGLVSAVEKALLNFEKQLPSSKVQRFAITEKVLRHSNRWIELLKASPDSPEASAIFEECAQEESDMVVAYILGNQKHLGEKFGLPLTSERPGLIAEYYSTHAIDIESVFAKFIYYYEQIKAIELQFLKKHGINIVFEEEAIDEILSEWLHKGMNLNAIFNQLSTTLEYGLKLVREKTGRNRFFLTAQALNSPDDFISRLLQRQPCAGRFPGCFPSRR